MKRIFQTISSLVGGGWTRLTQGQSKSTPVVITANSQPEKLQARMRENEMTHGQTVIADLHNVRLVKQKRTRNLEVRFCNMEEIKIHEQITPGDGGPLPQFATLPKGLDVPKRRPGYYTISNVIVTSNGMMQIEGTPETKWELMTADSSSH